MCQKASNSEKADVLLDIVVNHTALVQKFDT